MAEAQSKATNRTRARVASLLARAASAEAAMPVTSSATTSGTIVICSAFSHRPPIGSAQPALCATQGAPLQPAATPAPRPRTRASRIRVGCESFKSVALSWLCRYQAPHQWP
jgi:hypothetical protein